MKHIIQFWPRLYCTSFNQLLALINVPYWFYSPYSSRSQYNHNYFKRALDFPFWFLLDLWSLHVGDYNLPKHEGLGTYFPYQNLLIYSNRYTWFDVQVHRVDLGNANNIFSTLHLLCLFCHFPVAGKYLLILSLTIIDLERSDHTS